MSSRVAWPHSKTLRKQTLRNKQNLDYKHMIDICGQSFVYTQPRVNLLQCTESESLWSTQSCEGCPHQRFRDLCRRRGESQRWWGTPAPSDITRPIHIWTLRDCNGIHKTHIDSYQTKVPAQRRGSAYKVPPLPRKLSTIYACWERGKCPCVY